LGTAEDRQKDCDDSDTLAAKLCTRICKKRQNESSYTKEESMGNVEATLSADTEANEVNP
jgi:hypothetical protein